MTATAHILIADDDPIVAESLAELLAGMGHRAAIAGSAQEAISRLGDAARSEEAEPFNLLIADISLPGTDGFALLREVTKQFPGIAVIMLTAYGTIESAVRALRLGASDFLTKPVADAELKAALDRTLTRQALLGEAPGARRATDVRSGLQNIVGNDPRMLRVYELIQAVAPSRTTVLMTGESGTGKSLIAHAIHRASPRRARPFVEISCGSIPETLLESELFGHVKGAFTGAHTDKVGRFFAANHGTIFLDEINSASPGMQLKLLRVIQERRFEPVGSSQTVEVDVRIVLASNQPLELLVADGRFRQDLYYRINVVSIDLPPLRDRIADIQPLADHFLRSHAADLGKQLTGFSQGALDLLRRFRYPGNVRELQNIVERAAVLCRRPTIAVEDLPSSLTAEPGQAPAVAARLTDDQPWTPMHLEEALRDPERRIILRALKANGWNRQKTAEQLGINRTTLYKKMRALGIDGAGQEAA
jgi:DNA-binding NtrC family response regulator